MSKDKGNEVIPYSVGPLSASVCADNSLTPDEVERIFNLVSPSGTTNGWKISEDTYFAQGKPNPCPCDQHPETRKHYLFEC